MSNHKILLDHGSGGLATRQLIEEVFLKHLDNPVLSRMEDSAVLELPPGRLAFTTDSFVIAPLFFPGGNIGSLSVHGTVNDLSMQGARPMFLSLGLILEEGLDMDVLNQVARSIAMAADQSNVLIVAADTKVVGRGQADKIFINTSGIGVLPQGLNLGIHRACPGDKVIVSGFLGDHGASILLARSELPLDASIESDSASLWSLVSEVLENVRPDSIRLFRDPTRGGLATVLNEIADASKVRIEIVEELIPIRPQVKEFCDLLGLDPLYLANEGKFVMLAEESEAEHVLQILRANPLGKDASIIGQVTDIASFRGEGVILKTSIGGSRIVSMLSGEPLPRIC